MSSIRVAELWRFPVKSLVGEQVARLEVDQRGGVGDRLWSVYTADGKLGSGKSGRRFDAVPGLLDVRAQLIEGRVQITLPDGTTAFTDDPVAGRKLSTYVGQPVTLAAETGTPHFDDGPISLMGTASLAALAEEQHAPVDRTRFRANILVETDGAYVEDTWVGRELLVGSVRLRVDKMLPRCVMVNMSTADLPAQPGNLAALGRIHDACMGVVASVVDGGVIAIGDVIAIDPLVPLT
jgi:uncharacterized protein YcbX